MRALIKAFRYTACYFSIAGYVYWTMNVGFEFGKSLGFSENVSALGMMAIVLLVVIFTLELISEY